MPWIAGWNDQGLAFDISVHLGAIAALIGYFRGERLLLVRDWARLVRGQGASPNSRLA